MNTKLKCLLLDDELPGLTYIKMLCEQLEDVEVVKAFNDPEIFVKEVSGLDFDFCILDIEMPGMSGLQVANLLYGKPVIFATAYKEYAAEAYDVHAVDYIRKPIKFDRLKQAVQKVRQSIGTGVSSTARTFVQVNTNRGKAILFFDKVAYIRISENDSRDKVVRLFDGDELVIKNMTFDKLLSILPEKYFCRLNKQEVISIRAVQVFSYDEITINLLNEQGRYIQLSLTESYRNDFLQKVNI